MACEIVPQSWRLNRPSWQPGAWAPMAVESLKRRLDALTAEARLVRTAIRKSSKALGPTGAISDWKWKVGRAIIVLTHGDIAAGVSYVLLGREAAEACEVEEYTQKFRQWWDSSTEETRSRTVLNTTTSQGQAALARASKIIAEQNLVRWVHKVNLEHGIAPDTTVLNSRRPPDEQCVTNRTRTQWARRWRYRWSIALGRFAAREHISLQEKRSKALAMWQWSFFLNTQVRSPKKPLRINMDETCIRLHQRGKLGHIGIAAMKRRKSANPVTQNATLAQQRAACTLVALITDCEEARPYLPQVILVGEKSMRSSDKEFLAAYLPAHIVLRTGANAWMNGDAYKALLSLVSERLAAFQHTHQIILSVDTYPCHIKKETLACCGSHGIWPHLVPAKMTWALQPLDTHVFAKFKSHLASTWQRLQISKADPSNLEWRTMIRAVARTVEDVICSESWQSAFEHTGLTGRTLHISENVLAKVGMSERPDLSPRLPTALELAAIFPKSHVNLPIEELFGAWSGPGDPEPTGCLAVTEHAGLASSSTATEATARFDVSAAHEHRRRLRPVGVPLYPWQSQPE